MLESHKQHMETILSVRPSKEMMTTRGKIQRSRIQFPPRMKIISLLHVVTHLPFPFLYGGKLPYQPELIKPKIPFCFPYFCLTISLYETYEHWDTVWHSLHEGWPNESGHMQFFLLLTRRH